MNESDDDLLRVSSSSSALCDAALEPSSAAGAAASPSTSLSGGSVKMCAVPLPLATHSMLLLGANASE